jgi:surface protein
LESMGNMFYNCQKLGFLDITNLITSKVTSMATVFYSCRALTTLDITNFDTRKVKDMAGMFNLCCSLTSLDLSNFYTDSLLNMNSMFLECHALTSLNLSTFDTSKVTNMQHTFRACKSFTSLDLSYFNTSSVKNMERIFDSCNNLATIDLSSFDTSHVTNFYRMFDQCNSLTSLDLSNFNTELMENIESMFFNCKSLKYLDITSFNTQKIKNMNTLFHSTKSLIFLNLSSFDIYNSTGIVNILAGTNQNITICYNKSRVSEDFMYQASPYRYSCFEICVYHLHKKFTLDTGYCVDDCFSEPVYKYEYDNICYSSCPLKTEPESATSHICVECLHYYNYEQTDCISSIDDGYYLNDTTKKTIDKCPIQCSKCSKESVDLDLCIECDSIHNYFNKYEDPLNNGGFQKCYNTEQEGYYLNNSEKMYKPCYEKCKTCDEGGDDDANNCLECKDEYDFDNKNCKIKKIETTDVMVEPPITTEKIKETENIDINNKESTSVNNIDEPKINTEEATKSENIDIGNKLSTNINTIDEQKINTDVTQSSEQDNQIELDSSNLIKEEKTDENKVESISQDISRVTNAQNSENNEQVEYEYSYEINIDLEEFQNLKQNYQHTFVDFTTETINLLRSQLSLNSGQKLQIHISENISSDNIATIDYKYEIILGNGTKIDLDDIIEDIKVDIYVPISDLDLAKFDLAKKYAELGYDIYNINSKFYTDFCIPVYLGDNDMTLKDRKKDIYPQNITLCKNNCVYKSMNLEERRVICSCNLNDNNIYNSTTIEETEESFVKYLVDKINYKVYLCYKLFFNIPNLKSSYAFFIILSIFIILQIFNSIYLCGTLERLKDKLIEEKPKLKELKNELLTDNPKANPSKSKKEKKKKSVIHRNKAKSEKNLLNVLTKEKLMNTLENQPGDLISTQKETEETEIIGKKKKKKGKNKRLKIKEQIIEKEEKEEKQEKEEKEEKDLKIKEELYEKVVNKEDNINELPYSKAINEDKRNIIKIYFSFLVQKLDLINIIISDDRIKIVLYEEFILSLIINFSINALLYSDDVISNKYHNNGKLDFAVSLVVSILSNIITSLLCNFTKYSEGIEDKINMILETKHKKQYPRNIKKLLSYLKIKFIWFYISQFIFMANCIYYTVIFCILYSRSQISLIINFCYSFIESIITSFIIAFIILATRKIGLCCLSKELYNTSKYINNKF